MQKDIPEKTIKHGRVQAAVWANEGSKGLFRTVTFVRSYKDERGEYHSSNSFSLWDLLNIVHW